MKRALCCWAAVALLAVPAEGQRVPRQWLGLGIGAATGAAFTALYAAFRPRTDLGGCSRVGCVALVSVGVGGALGYLIGNEFEKTYRARYRHAPPLELLGRARSLAVTPTDIRLAAGRVVVAGDGGVELFEPAPSLTSLGLRARGLRAIGAADIDAATSGLAVGTAFGLYRFPLTADATGHLAVAGEVSALAVGGPGIAFAADLAIQLARFDGDSIRLIGEPVEESARITDLRWHPSGLLWAVTEDRVAVYGGGSGEPALDLVGSLPLRTPGRSIAFAEGLAVVATGSGGVLALDATDPTAPRELTNWGGARFVYDVATLGSRIYLAAGPEGLYVLEATDSTLRPVGLVRELGFVAAVETGDSAVFIADRSGILLRRLEPAAR